MKLPNRESAYVPTSKLKDYLLSETHVAGKSKAKFFRLLGFNENNVNYLEKGLIDIAQTQEIKEEVSSPHGRKYVIDGNLLTPNKPVRIRTIWIIDKGKKAPRFITAYLI